GHIRWECCGDFVFDVAPCLCAFRSSAISTSVRLHRTTGFLEDASSRYCTDRRVSDCLCDLANEESCNGVDILSWTRHRALYPYACGNHSAVARSPLFPTQRA